MRVHPSRKRENEAFGTIGVFADASRFECARRAQSRVRGGFIMRNSISRRCLKRGPTLTDNRQTTLKNELSRKARTPFPTLGCKT